ncbi:cupin domain-containing protein [Chryseobacterium sp. GMJ5]|uniref:Cupin domain-containing protein n=1 Tax=Chryseobacterium gilvum TaxID=2976534 RepID=A0ABT2VZQ1_9FLAO|nr:cupin domain-containing protein [Chryseobacterium gilvum]MCU7615468.1 cupin domain-containing protein [Chryseobacterium gilvum]
MKAAAGYIKLIHSIDSDNKSVLELNILPGEKTPWHYHTFFSETFEILKGCLEVGKGKNILHLKQGDIATIMPNEKHYYHNVSNEKCTITTTIVPGNKNFETALFILKGLANDDLTNNLGTPKRFIDLVLFVYLSNSRMVGVRKIAEPVFNFFAKAAIKKGKLIELTQKYCVGIL